MRNPAKAILVAILVAIPAPLVLAFLLSSTPEPLRLLAAGELVEALGSTGGIAAYIFALVIFGLVGFLAIAFSGKQQAGQRIHHPVWALAPAAVIITTMTKRVTMMKTALKATKKAP